MSVERVDYSSDEEFNQALQQEEAQCEQEYFEQQRQQEEEPDVVPCYGCGYQMYQENEEPKYNFCQKCKDIINGVKEIPDDKKGTTDDLPF